MDENEKYLLVDYLSAINNVITHTFKDMQRIKLACFDVSSNYIIFGASSGGIYILKREPCEFLKLIPSKEGAVVQIAISPDEKNVAVASSKGLVIVIEDFFVDLGLNYQVYTEHEGSTLTALKWYGNDLYCGDINGKISVITLMTLLTKAIFQTPSASLMHLDSSIVQIDIYLNYLLISTRTRTYLCDTEKEQYKQIGRKLRDGNYGACFRVLNSNINNYNGSNNTRGAYKTINDDETFSSTPNDNDVKIFCARPGARLWEANFGASVLATHQFKSSLAQKPSGLLKISRDEDARLEFSTYNNSECLVPETFNFGKIFPIRDRFILTFNSLGVYFFDTVSSGLVFWTGFSKNVKDVSVTNSLVYVWHSNLQISIISLVLLEELVIKILLKKQYYLCAEVCAFYSDDILKLLSKSRKIHLISILKTKIEDDNLLKKITPILDNLEDLNKKITFTKLRNGILAIDNGHTDDILNDRANDNLIPESVENCGKDVENKSDKFELALSLLYKQYKLNKTHKNVEIPDCTTLYTSLDVDKIFELFSSFIDYVTSKDNDSAKAWCQEQYLRQVHLKDIDLNDMEEESLTFLQEAFLEINAVENLTCSCNLPLPKTKNFPPKYYKIGGKLLDMTKNDLKYLKSIPYLFKHKIINSEATNLPLLVQFSDRELFEYLLPKFTYDVWDEVIKLLITLRRGFCVNCGNQIQTDEAITWTDIGLIMIESMGAENATKLLKRYSQFIENGELESRFYQACIFLSNFGLNMVLKVPVDFVRNVTKEEHSTRKFEDLMEKYLIKKYIKSPVPNTAVIKRDSNDQTTCCFCGLYLDIPMLNQIKKCNSNHVFHELCFTQNNSICNICYQ